MKGDKESLKNGRVDDQPESNTKAMPVFSNTEVEILYHKGLRIEREKLDQILALPRESLISDLEEILDDSISQFTYYLNKIEQEGWDEETFTFVIHALVLLGELEAQESIDSFFNVLSQSEEYHKIFLGDYLTVSLWEPLYKMANNQLDKCYEFMTRPGIDCYAKSVVSAMVEQIYFHQPGRKTDVTKWFRKVFNFFLSHDQDENLIDIELIALMICDVVDLNAKELLPDIKKLYDNDMVFHGISGTYDSVAKDIEVIQAFSLQREIMHIADRYEKVADIWSGYGDFEDDYDNGLWY